MGLLQSNRAASKIQSAIIKLPSDIRLAISYAMHIRKHSQKTNHIEMGSFHGPFRGQMRWNPSIFCWCGVGWNDAHQWWSVRLLLFQLNQMQFRSGERPRKNELVFQREPNQPAKHHLLQSQEFGSSVRRHSVYGGLQQDCPEPFPHKISSKELKSLQKYNSARGRGEGNGSVEKAKKRRAAEHGAVEPLFLTKRAYKYLNMVGKGGFGKVWKVEHLATGRTYAMKEMSKAIIITKRSIDSILNEREFLATLRHKFIVSMLYAFQDEENLYILMNLMEGGDLRYHLSKLTVFSEGETKFMIASILLALDYLHSKLIIHRDVKPQNIVFDRQGYAYLTDLGIAKHLRPNNSQDTSGTPGYMAPEVMFHQNHRYQVDFYAVGVIIYEVMMGRRPYLGKSRQEIKQKIKERQVIIPKRDIPEGWSIEAADFVNKLLQRKPVQRLGWAGIQEVKQHPWLRHFPWADLIAGTLDSPVKRFYNFAQVRYRPTDNDTHYSRLLNKNKEMLKRGTMQDYFEGYTYEDYQTTAEHTKIY